MNHLPLAASRGASALVRGRSPGSVAIEESHLCRFTNSSTGHWRNEVAKDVQSTPTVALDWPRPSKSAVRRSPKTVERGQSRYRTSSSCGECQRHQTGNRASSSARHPAKGNPPARLAPISSPSRALVSRTRSLDDAAVGP
jgi:hypothetical protein